MKNIILASNSPRRKELLAQIGIEFQVKVSHAEEMVTSTVPSEVVMKLSRDKALNVASDSDSDALVIGADTVVASNGQILGKPKTRQEAYEMIKGYAGGSHSVFTGVTLVCGKQIKTFYEETIVHVRDMSDSDIYDYIDRGDCFDKAGAYGIQGFFAQYVSGIEGDYFNVVGLPISRTAYEIKKILEDCNE